MDPITVTTDEVMTTLRAVVAERPEYVYRKPSDVDNTWDACLYVHPAGGGREEEAPGCVVGTVLHRLGVPLAELAMREGTAAYSVVHELLDVPDEAQAALQYAQTQQDGGSTWSRALQAAEERVVAEI
ncbi:hypothetical protein ABT264_19475 [Streptomyces virginiae]|uniref:hypothetical protein n=1 Tax=Streptomyces virginiae TaxID=1961 RepID=UPI00332F44D9